MNKDNIKNNIIASLVLALAITTGGWAVSHDNVNTLVNEVVKREDSNEKLSIEIANLENVIVKKEDDLNVKNMVIENKDTQINEQKSKIDEQERKITLLRTEIMKLKEENKRSYPTSKTVSRSKSNDVLYSLTVNASAYTAFCAEGCTGKTASGDYVGNSIYVNGYRVIATDPRVIPMYSIVEIEGLSGRFIALDTGGWIKGNKIDVLVESTNDAKAFGRKNLKVNVIRKGR